MATLSDPETIILYSLLLGIGATAFMDLWALFLKIFLSVPFRGYNLVGRWLLYMREGRFFHKNIKDSRPLAGEDAVGWIFHYIIGMVFALLLIGLLGSSWIEHPALLPAVFVGLATLVFPFCVMQPCWGFGLASRSLPDRWKARSRSVMSHVSFGVGLYVSGQVLSWV